MTNYLDFKKDDLEHFKGIICIKCRKIVYDKFKYTNMKIQNIKFCECVK